MFTISGKMKKHTLLLGITSILIFHSTAVAVPCGKLIVFITTREEPVSAIISAVVNVTGTSLSGYSDVTGKAIFENLPIGIYDVCINSAGFKNSQIKDVNICQDITTIVDVRLCRDSIPAHHCINNRVQVDSMYTHKIIGDYFWLNNVDMKLSGDPTIQSEKNIGNQLIDVNIGGYLWPDGLKYLKYNVSGKLDRQKYANGWHMLPHTNKEVYSGQGELDYSKGPFNIAVGGTVSRNQYGYYNTLFKYDLDHYASRMDKNNQLTANLKHKISENISYSLSYYRNKINSIIGVRKGYSGGYQGWFSDYEFNQPYPHAWFTDPDNPYYTGDTLDGYVAYSTGNPNINPYGVANFFYSGDFHLYQENGLVADKCQAEVAITAARNNLVMLNIGAWIGKKSTRQISYPFAAILDSTNGSPEVQYLYAPLDTTLDEAVYSLKIQDGVTMGRLYGQFGIRLARREFTTINSNYYPLLISEEKPYVDSVKHYFAPVFELEYPSDRAYLFTISYNKHLLNPEYRYLHQDPFNMGPQHIQNMIDQNMLAQASDVFKANFISYPSNDIELSLGWQYQKLDGVVDVAEYYSPENPSYLGSSRSQGELQEIRAKLMVKPIRYLKGYFDYSISWAQSGEYDTTTVDWFYGDTTTYEISAHPLDFDQRYRLVTGISLNFGDGEGPRMFGIHPVGNAEISLKQTMAGGLPYTKTDYMGRTIEEYNKSRGPSLSSTDISIEKRFKLFSLNSSIGAEVSNLFNVQNSIYVDPVSDRTQELERLEAFRTPIEKYLSDGTLNPNYSVKADLNRDDYISADEHYNAALKAYTDIINDQNNGLVYDTGIRASIRLTLSF
jgi:hypothetical protein